MNCYKFKESQTDSKVVLIMSLILVETIHVVDQCIMIALLTHL